MNLTTFTNLFSGSPFRPLLCHRHTVLEALGLLNRQLQSALSSQFVWTGRPEWLTEFTVTLEKHEQELIASLHQPMMTTPPKEFILSMMQTQTSLAHTISRLAERLSYRPMQLLPDMQDQVVQLCRHFGKSVFLLRQSIAELEELNKAGFKKQHATKLKQAHQSLTRQIDALRESGCHLREWLFQHEYQMQQMDIALLLLTLDDIEDLTLWMKSVIIQSQS